MKMVLQFQSVKLQSDGKYSGEATYLTELLFEQTSYQTVEKNIRETVAQTDAEIKGIAMTIDGNSGMWGCTVQYRRANAPLPLAFGVDLDTPETIYDYYIEYANKVIDERNQAMDADGNYLYDEISKVISIAEETDGLFLRVKYADDTEGSVDIPYPSN